MAPSRQYNEESHRETDWGMEMSNSPRHGPFKSVRTAVRRIFTKD